MKTLVRLVLATGLGTIGVVSLLALAPYVSADTSSSGILGAAAISATADSQTISPHAPVCLPDLVVTKEARPNHLLYPGDPLTYTITYYNKGSSLANGVKVIDLLPIGIKRVASSSNPDYEPPEKVGPVWIWSIGTLGVGQHGVITLQAMVDTSISWGQLTTVTNWAAIVGSDGDSDPTNNIYSATQKVVPGDPYTVTLAPAPNMIAPTDTSLVTAIVTDRWGNPVVDGTFITFTADSLGTFVTAQPRTTINGVAASTFQAGAVAGVSIVTGTTATAWGTASITITSGAAYTLTLQADPISQAVGGSSVLTATVTDQFGHRVDGATVTFVTDLGGVLSPRTTMDGVATSQISSTVAGTAHITATSGTAHGTAVVTFTPGAAYTLMLQADPISQTVGNSSVLTATVADQFSNLVDGATVTFVTDLGKVVSPRVTTNGVATSQISSTVAGTAHVTATSGIAQGTAMVTFTPGAVYTITLQADPTWLIADGASTSVITATVVDPFGNPVADGTQVSFSAVLGSVSTPHVTMNGRAVAIFTAGTVTGTAIVTATANGRSGSVQIALTLGAVDLSSSVKLTSADVITTVGQLTYTIILTNSGSLVAANVTLTDPIPLGTVFVPGSLSGGATYNLSLDQIEWSGQVLKGGSVRFSYTVTVTIIEPATIVNLAYVSLHGVLDRILTARTRIIPASSPTSWHIYLPLVMHSSQ